MACKHKWILICANCEAEDGDDVYECEKCGDDKYESMENKIKESKSNK